MPKRADLSTLVLFDFDGTITTNDTFPLFFNFTFGTFKFLCGFLIHLPLFILFKFRLYSAENFKKSILSLYLKNKNESWIKKKGEEFHEFLELNGSIKTDFIEKITNYKKNGATVAIVSASLDTWLIPFCEKHKLICICTELDYEQGIFKGNLKTKNCNNAEKKTRIEHRFNLDDFKTIIAYGNSSGDDDMFLLATEKYKVA